MSDQPTANKTRSTSEGFVIEATPEQQAKQNHLLIIAVNYYKDKGISNLSNCVRDAEGLIEVLTRDYYFNKENITFVRSRFRGKGTTQKALEKAAKEEKIAKGYGFVGEATHSNIIGQLKAIATKSQKQLKKTRQKNKNAASEANYIIWYSGHGIYDEILDEGYWLPSDGIKGDNATYIENSTIRTHLKAIESHHTVLISDSCYSGTLFSSGKQRDTGVPRVYKHASRWGMTAGRRNQTVSDGDLNSPFAKQLIAVLARKREVWINDLGSEIVKAIGVSEAQSPMCEPLSDLRGHDGGQFVFLPKNISETDYWYIAWRENTRAAYYAFLAKFPDGEYDMIALAALNTFADNKQPSNEDAAIVTFDYLKAHTTKELAFKYLKLVVSLKVEELKIRTITEAAIESHQFLSKYLPEEGPRYLRSFSNGKITNNEGKIILKKPPGILIAGVKEMYDYLDKKFPNLAREYLRAFFFAETSTVLTEELTITFDILTEIETKETIEGKLKAYFSRRGEKFSLLNQDIKETYLFLKKNLADSGEVATGYVHEMMGRYREIHWIGEEQKTLYALLLKHSEVLASLYLSNILLPAKGGKEITEEITALFGHLPEQEISFAQDTLLIMLGRVSPIAEQQLAGQIAYFSPNAETVITKKQHNVKLWSLAGEELQNFKVPFFQCATFSLDGQRLLTGSRSDTIKLWEVSGKELQTFKWPESSLRCVAFSPDGQQILAGGGNGNAKLWEVSTKELQTFIGNKSIIYCVAFSPDGQLILTGGSDRKPKLWDLSGKVLQVLTGHKASISCLAFSPDGQFILTADIKQTIILWDMSGQQLQTFNGHNKSITCIVFSPDSQYILTGSKDGTVRLWGIDGHLKQIFDGGYEAISSIAFSPDGKSILTGSKDGKVKTWTITSFEWLKETLDWKRISKL